MDSADTIAPQRWLVGDSRDLAERGRLVVDVGTASVGIFRLHGVLHAYKNVCVHQGGPVCQGLLVPRVVETLDIDLASTGMAFDENTLHIVCPWHGFEFSVQTGEHPGSSDLKLCRVDVSEENGRIYVIV